MELEEMIEILKRNGKTSPKMQRIYERLVEHTRIIQAVERRLDALEARRGMRAKARPKASNLDLTRYAEGKGTGGVALDSLPCALYAKLGGKL